MTPLSAAQPPVVSSDLHRLTGQGQGRKSPVGLEGVAGVEAAEQAQLERAALDFEGILVRQLLEPLEKSLTGSMGGEGASPMVGGMIISGFTQSIVDGGGLGLASVIEEALRAPSSKPVSSAGAMLTEPGIQSQADGET